jgi:hypothetical protein
MSDRPPIHETLPADSLGAGAGFHGPVPNTADSHPTSTTGSVEEESAQDICDVDHKKNSKKNSKRGKR